jgi:hypothetical protein
LFALGVSAALAEGPSLGPPTPPAPAVALNPYVQPQIPYAPPQPTPPHDRQGCNIVLFAGRTVELTLPGDWTVRQIPLPGELRLVAGPGDVPADPRRLERGLWLAYQRTESPAAGRSLEAELRSRLAQEIEVQPRLFGWPQSVEVGGFSGLKQNLEMAPPSDAGLPCRASFIVVQTPWGVFEMMAVTPLFAADDMRAALKAALASVRFHAPRPLPAISADGIADAQPILGSWKGPQGSLHFLPTGQVQLDADAVTTLTPEAQETTAIGLASRQIRGRFTAQGDVIYITWADGSQLNHRWQLHEGELLLMDHTRNVSRLKRLFDAPPLEALSASMSAADPTWNATSR